jgi:hypothetical protein
MGNHPSRTTVTPPTTQTFFPDSATRETEDAAFYERMRFIQQECLDNSDDESETADETPATDPKKKRARKRPILEYTDEHGVRKELPPEMTNWYLSYVGSDLFVERIAEKRKSSAAASACPTMNIWSF